MCFFIYFESSNIRTNFAPNIEVSHSIGDFVSDFVFPVDESIHLMFCVLLLKSTVRKLSINSPVTPYSSHSLLAREVLYIPLVHFLEFGNIFPRREAVVYDINTMSTSAQYSTVLRSSKFSSHLPHRRLISLICSSTSLLIFSSSSFFISPSFIHCLLPSDVADHPSSP